MAQIAIPESVGRELYYTFFKIPKDYFVVDATNKAYPKFGNATYVVKPDYTISKRSKNNLLGINLSANEVNDFLKKNKNKEFNGIILRRFLVTKYLPHHQEYYVSITANPKGYTVVFSQEGGIEIEENWKKTKQLHVPVLEENPDFSPLITDKTYRDVINEYLKSLFLYIKTYGFAFLEINPFIIIDNVCIPLDFKGRLDDYEFFNLQQYVDIYSLMEKVLEEKHKEEAYVKELDSNTGASLKLKIMNRDGRIWPLIAGAGASIIYFDSLIALGYEKEIGIYTEYGGNPPYDLMVEYARTIIELMLASKAKNKVFLVLGANANFTDVAKTFKAIIKVLNDHVTEIQKQKIKILVRRGGPNVHEGFSMFREFAQKNNISVHVEGIESSLTHILLQLDHE
jgi:succinyl-CoA synthetase beta subunit